MVPGSLEEHNGVSEETSRLLAHLGQERDSRRALASVLQHLCERFHAEQGLILADPQVTQNPNLLLSWGGAASNLDADRALSTIARFVARTAYVSPRTLLQLSPEDEPGWKEVADPLASCGIGSVLAKTIRYVGMPLATVMLFRPRGNSWSTDEVAAFEYSCRLLAQQLYAVLHHYSGNGSAIADSSDTELEVHTSGQESSLSKVGEEAARYRRLVEFGDCLFFQTDTQHKILYINQKAFEFFGAQPEDFLGRTAVCWYELAHLDDRARLERRIADLTKEPESFAEEFRIINHLNGKERWLLVQFTPVLDENNALRGWDGFGIDITKRQEAKTALDLQSRKIRALYTVASAIRGFSDPTNIASRGLHALCDATGAQAGMCFLYPRPDQGTAEMVAHNGFSPKFVARLKKTSTMPRLSAHVAEHGQPLVIADVRTDPRASRDLAEEEGIRSALVVPISVEESIFGTISLFHREIGTFSSGDVLLVSAAGNQIGLAARQAYLLAAYRRQTKNVTALYRLSHELSGSLSLDEVFQKAFAIIREELGVKRLWLGLLNETNTRIIGQAAYGPGWKRRLVEINVEVAGRDHPIAEVVTTRKPLVIDDPEKVLQEFGVRRFFSRFSISAVGLIPLISAGQLLGVLAFQPSADSRDIEDEEITLIYSLASEIASTILTKRLDERVGDADKMRAAGLLAAGIAHNFNNLLQAILGQASLLEMQQITPAQAERAAKIINDAAAKGATLVKQLMSFANLEEPSKEISDVNTVVERGKKSLARHLKPHQTIRLDLAPNLPRTFVDPSQLLRVLTSLVVNASEASEEGDEIEIFTDRIIVDHDTPHFEVPFGEYITIGIRDHGVGMDEETKRRCFEPFYTTKDVDPASGLSMSGAGLGLASAFALARKNGGRLVVDSRKGHGSVFTLYVPVHESKQKSDSRVDVAAAQPELAKQIEIRQVRRVKSAETAEQIIEQSKKGGVDTKLKR